ALPCRAGIAHLRRHHRDPAPGDRRPAAAGSSDGAALKGLPPRLSQIGCLVCSFRGRGAVDCTTKGVSPMRASTIWASAAVLSLLGLASCDRSHPLSMTTAPNSLAGAGVASSSNNVTVPFDPKRFVAVVDNPYYPLPQGTVWTYRGTSKTGVETNVVEVTRQ